MNKNTVVLAFRTTKQIAADLRIKAESEHRTVGNYVSKLIKQDVGNPVTDNGNK